MFELVDNVPQSPVIKVIGVGGGGGNAVNHMVKSNIEGVEFICANTDAQALKNIGARTILQLGTGVTKGLGAGANPEVGRQAALEDRERIAEVLQGTNMVFITTGMGGGTGTGAAPIIAEVAKEMGILTVAVVTRPFPFEGRKRMQIADEGIRMLSESVDSLITIPNEKLLTILGKDASLLSAFAKADDVLAGAVRGISDIIKRPGMINVDFADVRTVMSEMGMAMMGTGCASGPNRAREATEAAIRNPLLEDVNLQGARGILVNITAGPDLSLGEYSDVGSIIEAFASEHAMVKVGTVIDPDMRDELHVTVVATGLGAKIEKPVKVIDNTLQTTQQAPAQQASRQEAPSVNYRDLDRPTVMRNQAHAGATAAAKMNPNDDLDYLDIPAFLRRQAD
ncbi:cell division protein FtsZ [Pseudomonas syringae pv. aptata]|jgi:cell division protein FtsZ|uniref:Cell division protein FtsZ n=66 Tax=Pseudomonas TaxID=286 RepID=A0A1H1XUU0_PSESX|nr:MULTISPECIES: cell division protein FtsZ [Pseudomonas]EGH21227.1 cell division protein FtsZ [Pseudomonas amygdali pv. mori str. 301020]EGH41820.1 cell division protein FtsZ [Pseudomonas syringae pv. pisi str. 1704B]EPN03652.1 cell division protein FtsZ [Pseudomonas syringae pv. actinidiae ICMP 19070]EPN60565.1 cell division protein FtsZ [Pseudomonas syringae pv. actinidiae ICMP 19096]EPN64993.1 cell division protein FtsZ [Pseudomonas syringae pv. actinidiae ICMP 19079]EPN70788.1 cell divis